MEVPIKLSVPRGVSGRCAQSALNLAQVACALAHPLASISVIARTITHEPLITVIGYNVLEGV